MQHSRYAHELIQYDDMPHSMLYYTFFSCHSLFVLCVYLTVSLARCVVHGARASNGVLLHKINWSATTESKRKPNMHNFNCAKLSILKTKTMWTMVMATHWHTFILSPSLDSNKSVPFAIRSAQAEHTDWCDRLYHDDIDVTTIICKLGLKQLTVYLRNRFILRSPPRC